MRPSRILAVLAVTCVLPLAAGVAPARGASLSASEWSGLSFHVGPDLRLMAGGAAASLEVSYVCSKTRLFGANFGYAFVTARVIQRFGDGKSADGSDLGGDENTALTCDRRTHRLHVLVFAGIPGGGFAFRWNVPALATVSVLACDVEETACIQPTKLRSLVAHAAGAVDPLNQPVHVAARLGSAGVLTLLVPPGCPVGGYEWVTVDLSQRLRDGRVIDDNESSNPSDCRRHVTPVSVPMSFFPATPGPAYVLINWKSCDSTATHCKSRRIEGVLTIS